MTDREQPAPPYIVGTQYAANRMNEQFFRSDAQRVRAMLLQMAFEAWLKGIILERARGLLERKLRDDALTRLSPTFVDDYLTRRVSPEDQAVLEKYAFTADREVAESVKFLSKYTHHDLVKLAKRAGMGMPPRDPLVRNTSGQITLTHRERDVLKTLTRANQLGRYPAEIKRKHPLKMDLEEACDTEVVEQICKKIASLAYAASIHRALGDLAPPD